MTRLLSRIAALIFLLPAIIFLPGCQTGPPPPRGPAQGAVAPPTSDGFPQLPPGALPEPNMAFLKNRVICIDPGHGGRWPGAVAPSNGLRESDLNLSVALATRALLTRNGARVVLTRDADRALRPDDMGEDLAARPALAAANKAEVFISIHHNADINAGSLRNDLEVYYKMDGGAPSLELGQCLTYALARWLRPEAESKRLRTGNYKVLRLATIPAVLLESSYMTSAANAAWMATPEGVQAEAQAIAAGLAIYFSLDPPRVTSAKALSAVKSPYLTRVTVNLDNATRVLPASVEARIDGELITGNASASSHGFVWTSSQPFANGDAQLDIRFQNEKGASASLQLPIQTNRPPASITVRRMPDTGSPMPGSRVGFEARVLDAAGMPVMDGVRITSRETRQESVALEGTAWFYLDAAQADTARTFMAGRVHGAVERSPKTDSPEMRSFQCVDVRTGKGIASVKLRQGDWVVETNPEGYGWIPASRVDGQAGCDGYEAKQVILNTAHMKIPMTPVAGGVLQGKRIVLDPSGGGASPGAVSATGILASDIALEVARMTAAKLRAAGATVYMTRDADMNIPDTQRVADCLDFYPNLYVAVSYGSQSVETRTLDSTGHAANPGDAFAAHYTNSADGERLARLIAGAVGGLAVFPSAAYVLQQTPCSAVLVQPANISVPADEAVCREPAARARHADAIYQALSRFYGGKM